MITLQPSEWALAVVAALIVGVSKAGIGGLGMLSVVLFAQIMPAKQATGMVLPLLCFGDIIGATTYRKHAKWPHIWRLFPWTAAGVIIGYLALDRINEHQARWLIGGIILTLVGLHLIRRHVSGHESDHGAWFPPTIGVLAGFTTLVANAAGPLMAVYMLSMRLPKLDFVGTGAVFFLLLNLFKVPFMVDLGLINAASFSINLWLAPAVVVGAWFGRKLVMRIDQRAFENIALALSLIAGLKLLF
ncbi:sulfite exporter TauE/SafE family protein [Horticoccus sp. 23ND18S-11]|uniref:sulfite exporter TauE/SafE family protein n=1 Tax=Horticoccus sp. 23ND18S-11 TaxID=3391832 RepID=UPI0039C95AF1